MKIHVLISELSRCLEYWPKNSVSVVKRNIVLCNFRLYVVKSWVLEDRPWTIIEKSGNSSDKVHLALIELNLSDLNSDYFNYFFKPKSLGLKIIKTYEGSMVVRDKVEFKDALHIPDGDFDAHVTSIETQVMLIRLGVTNDWSDLKSFPPSIKNLKKLYKIKGKFGDDIKGYVSAFVYKLQYILYLLCVKGGNVPYFTMHKNSIYDNNLVRSMAAYQMDNDISSVKSGYFNVATFESMVGHLNLMKAKLFELGLEIDFDPLQRFDDFLRLVDSFNEAYGIKYEVFLNALNSAVEWKRKVREGKEISEELQEKLDYIRHLLVLNMELIGRSKNESLVSVQKGESILGVGTLNRHRFRNRWTNKSESSQKKFMFASSVRGEKKVKSMCDQDLMNVNKEVNESERVSEVHRGEKLRNEDIERNEALELASHDLYEGKKRLKPPSMKKSLMKVIGSISISSIGELGGGLKSPSLVENHQAFDGEKKVALQDKFSVPSQVEQCKEIVFNEDSLTLNEDEMVKGSGAALKDDTAALLLDSGRGDTIDEGHDGDERKDDVFILPYVGLLDYCLGWQSELEVVDEEVLMEGFCAYLEIFVLADLSIDVSVVVEYTGDMGDRIYGCLVRPKFAESRVLMDLMTPMPFESLMVTKYGKLMVTELSEQERSEEHMFLAVPDGMIEVALSQMNLQCILHKLGCLDRGYMFRGLEMPPGMKEYFYRRYRVDEHVDFEFAVYYVLRRVRVVLYVLGYLQVYDLTDYDLDLLRAVEAVKRDYKMRVEESEDAVKNGIMNPSLYHRMCGSVKRLKVLMEKWGMQVDMNPFLNPERFREMVNEFRAMRGMQFELDIGLIEVVEEEWNRLGGSPQGGAIASEGQRERFKQVDVDTSVVKSGDGDSRSDGELKVDMQLPRMTTKHEEEFKFYTAREKRSEVVTAMRQDSWRWSKRPRSEDYTDAMLDSNRKSDRSGEEKSAGGTNDYNWLALCYERLEKRYAEMERAYFRMEGSMEEMKGAMESLENQLKQNLLSFEIFKDGLMVVEESMRRNEKKYMSILGDVVEQEKRFERLKVYVEYGVIKKVVWYVVMTPIWVVYVVLLVVSVIYDLYSRWSGGNIGGENQARSGLNWYWKKVGKGVFVNIDKAGNWIAKSSGSFYLKKMKGDGSDDGDGDGYNDSTVGEEKED